MRVARNPSRLKTRHIKGYGVCMQPVQWWHGNAGQRISLTEVNIQGRAYPWWNQQPHVLDQGEPLNWRVISCGLTWQKEGLYWICLSKSHFAMNNTPDTWSQLVRCSARQWPYDHIQSGDWFWWWWWCGVHTAVCYLFTYNFSYLVSISIT